MASVFRAPLTRAIRAVRAYASAFDDSVRAMMRKYSTSSRCAEDVRATFASSSSRVRVGGGAPAPPSKAAAPTGRVHVPSIERIRWYAATSRTEQAVSGSGKLNVLRYGRVLKARRLVGARGGGAGFDGVYHVRSVTHRIARGSYTQDFTLVRNALVSTVSALSA